SPLPRICASVLEARARAIACRAAPTAHFLVGKRPAQEAGTPRKSRGNSGRGSVGRVPPIRRPDCTRFPMLRFVPLACLLLPFSAAAQTPPSANSKAQANAEAKANSSDSKSNKSSSSQTVTHRVVVENGKTIVDERIVDNKPA